MTSGVRISAFRGVLINGLVVVQLLSKHLQDRATLCRIGLLYQWPNLKLAPVYHLT